MRNGSVIRSYDPEVIINSIASRSTIRKAKKMMEGVVEHGTATNLKNPNYKIAGKTGTAQIAKNKYGYKTGKSGYLTRLLLWDIFPLKTLFTHVVVVVNSPSNGVISEMCGRNSIQGDLDKVYATRFFQRL